MRRLGWGLGLALALAGCAAPPAPPVADAEGWHAVPLPGKAQTQYAWASKDGRRAVWARAEKSASMWRRPLARPADGLGEVSFSWWVPAPLANASVADVEREDAAGRVVFAFGGDHSALPLRTRAMFDLAEALSGERPPYATLMYVFDSSRPPGSVVVNPRTDRIRKIVLDGDTAATGRWRDHRRDLAADFRRAFGEEPGPLLAVGVMTDTDNTGGKAEAWYGPIRFD